MKKTSKLVDKLNPNTQVEVTVTNKKVYEEDDTLVHQPTVTIKVKLPKQKEKFDLQDSEAIEKFVNDIDFDEVQQELDV